MKTHFADPLDLLNFTLTITPDEGSEIRVFLLALTFNVRQYRNVP